MLNNKRHFLLIKKEQRIGEYMYLKSIKTVGFKSFADKTELDLKPGITVVVGPNGSGKSNIVDAIRWVLGEQSVKALRGTGGMSDVIFSGSKSRSPHNYASVTLTFDNTSKYLNTEFSEVEVKRVCYQTGENEYYLNNNQVRLKDVTDLFIDTGAGRESFNIISQGKVSDIINQKPEERRIIIEDAAGVLKYKKRKEESLRKLERTNDNLSRINLIINELETNLEPLRNQAEVAKKYLSLKEELEGTEIALIAKDINSLSTEYDVLKEEVKILEENILTKETNINKEEDKIESIKLKIIKLEENITKLNDSLLKLTEELSSLDAKRQVTKERQKYESDDNKIKDYLVELKERELSLKNNLNLLEKEINDLKDNLKTKQNRQENLSIEIRKFTASKNNLTNELNNLSKKQFALKNTKDILEDNINNNAKIPYSVKSIINNPRLEGIHGALGSLIETEVTYGTAIEIALGFNANVVITDDEVCTKKAINFLNENNLGRATFFPLNVIKPRGIDPDILNIVSSHQGYISLASDLVTYDSLYRNIVLNQLGNTIIVNNIDSMNDLGKKINYRYRIITLDGELLHTGGSVTGGSTKSAKGLMNDKFELEKTEKELVNITNELMTVENSLKQNDNELLIVTNNYNDVTREMLSTQEIINQKEYNYKETTNRYDELVFDLKSNKAVLNNEVDKELTNILEEYSSLVNKKEILESDYNKLIKQKEDYNNEVLTLESNRKLNNQLFNTDKSSLHEKEIRIGRIETKLDSLLGTLNEEYSLTYEKAYETYKLELDENVARSKVLTLKSEIKSLGDVNTGSVSEFERINKRYTFLSTQKDDLIGGINNLNEIISSLDETMKERFKDTFELVNKEFAKVFKELFKGGKGFLTLTNPDDLLETGVEISAEPPGKSLRTISLLSGGEMTLTAISLLFSVLNIRPVPFCVLDEVEANLDDVNVETFGKYLQSYDNKTQFIIISHKKRTMEYANTLYGVTMQESGVSKLVSVKLSSLDK